MSWNRLGRIFHTDRQLPWLVSHAANPMPLPWHNNELLVLFNGRDEEGRSLIAALMFDPRRSFDEIELIDKPLLLPGELGAFDESGVSIGNCLQDEDGRWRLYYLGWSLGQRTAFYNCIGLAYADSPPEGFARASLAPVLTRCAQEPFSLSYPWVVRRRDGCWQMLYGSTTQWLDSSTMLHELHVAHSRDGVAWQPSSEAVLPLLPGEVAHSRPCLLCSNNKKELWFSAKTAAGYHIGYAYSEDGENWHRADESGGLFPGEAAWEDREVCYPAVIEFAGQRYLFYCGNGYGRTGFGLAHWS